MSTRFGHVGIVVKDLDLMTEFFCETLGFSVEHRFRRSGAWIDKVVGLKDVDLEIAILGTDSQRWTIELLKYHSHSDDADNRRSNQLYANHILIDVNDAFLTYRAMQKAGCQPFSEPLTSPNGAKTAFYAHDPEGGIIEICETHDEAHTYPAST